MLAPMPVTYDRKSPAEYAAQRLALRLKVQEGAPLESAARVLNLPRSTARLWAAQDGFRAKDRAADDAGAARPETGDWAKAGRGRKAPEPDEGDLPPADYPELKDLTGRGRLAALRGLSDTARMRAVAAIEEGCITFAMASLREAQRLERAARTLRAWLADYPEDEGAEIDADDWRDEFEEMLRAEEEGRAPVLPPHAPPAPEALEIWAAIQAAEDEDLAQLGLTREDFPDDEIVQRELQLAEVFARMVEQRRKWMSLPGRVAVPVVVCLPERWRGVGVGQGVSLEPLSLWACEDKQSHCDCPNKGQG